MSRLGTITRRTFLVGAVAIAGGVAFGAWYVRRPYANPLLDELGDDEVAFNPFVKIGEDETITIIAPRAEMGQGISTTLAAFVAEELDVRLDQVSVEHGPASPAYYNAAMMEEAGPFPFFDESLMAEVVRSSFGTVAKVLGLQATGGSSSTRDGFVRMRQAGAAARIMLTEAAARRLGVAAAELTTADGAVIYEASGQRLTYGALARDAAGIEPPSNIRLREPSHWKLLGTSQQRVDMLAKATGAPVFGIDVSAPDMLFGTVKMSPVFWREPANADLSKAEAVPGVIRIVPIASTYGHGFGILATNTWAAFRAANLIEADWGTPDYPADSAAIDARLTEALADPASGSSMRNDGDVETLFADAPRDRFVEAEYTVPLLAHACMEPMNATAKIADGKLTVWAPNQVPTLTAQLCASALGMDTEDVTVHTTQMGGGFGRREVDFSIYAALLADAAGGRPVKVTWTREEDIRRDVFRPAAKGRFRARLDDAGLPVALDMTIAAPSILGSVMRRTFPSISPVGPDATITQGAHDQPYAIENYRVRGIKADLGVPVGFWRSVGLSFNTYFHEGFLDEIAVAGGIDPVELRRRLVADYPAALGVVDRVAEMANWGERVAEGRARGFAFALAFGSWVAQIVEIAETPAGIRIEKTWIAADVGIALDPSIIEAQLVSGAVFGFSSAMNQEITLREGRVEQSNFHDYDAMRMHQCPRFEIAILENAEKMGGVGELSTPTSIAALANAVFALTGKRVRQLPLSREVAFA
ncbi:molybdopterin cofactor-binding domain-containing protein [Aliihoeflea sp. 40Bstr573]|uniref:xanthine dehydrogenase family protein molybdopterin-binding subunit n=1 Tax=Aliihoeflea sp. 40Bstr573 TaxID=2696467 RepID=UPI0020948511|nr:molybdopterin cofactor-binding domain-containing protein [Aliihoeflea sp. 40Bstr573]MCO6388205.1 molybdopterin-dependent oxidoreductase [Aliihoeflea sp. 40Bstr573]